MKDKEIFNYILNSHGYTLNKYYGNDKIVNIPETYEGKPVNIISIMAFSYNKHIVEVNLPSTIEIIYFKAFHNCSNLEKIKLNEGLVSIQDESFSNCIKLKKIVFPSTLNIIGNYTFDNGYALKDITFLNQNTEIKKNTFCNCNAIENIDFLAWKFLTALQLHNIVNIKIKNWDNLDLDEQTQISNFIKRKPTLKNEILLSGNAINVNFLLGLQIKITLDDLNKYLEHTIKEEQTEITAILLEYKNNKYSQSQIEQFNENKELVEIGLETPTIKQLKEKWNVGNINGGVRITGYKGSNTNETIPKLINDSKGNPINILNLSFVDNKSFKPIENLIIEATIELINERTFSQCSSLRSIVLPSSLKHIGCNAFNRCSSLEEIEIPQNVRIISNYMFFMCYSLEKVILPDYLTDLGYCCFAYCKNLKNIVLPYGITEIPSAAFLQCESLTEITIPTSVKLINSIAFSDCINLTKVNLPPDVVIFENSFDNCPFQP